MEHDFLDSGKTEEVLEQPKVEPDKKKDKVKATKPVTSGARKMCIREFLSNSRESKRDYNKYVVVAFQQKQKANGLMAERKTQKQWLKDLEAFANKKI